MDTTTATATAEAQTLRLAGYMLTILNHTTDSPEAADLRRTIRADRAGIGLDTVQEVSRLLSMRPERIFEEATT